MAEYEREAEARCAEQMEEQSNERSQAHWRRRVLRRQGANERSLNPAELRGGARARGARGATRILREMLIWHLLTPLSRAVHVSLH